MSQLIKKCFSGESRFRGSAHPRREGGWNCGKECPRRSPQGEYTHGAFLGTTCCIFIGELYSVETFGEREFPLRTLPCCLAISLLRQESPEKVRKQYALVLRAPVGEPGKTWTHVPHPLEPNKDLW